MTRLRPLFAAALACAALACAALALAQPAHAAGQLMCQGTAPATASGPSRWVAAASGAAYTLDNRGCAVIAQTDIGDAGASGLVQTGSQRSIIFSTGVLSGTTSVAGPNIPAGMYLREVIVDNTTANAVTGGIDIGKTSGAADIVSALTCAASCLTFVADSALLLRVFSKTVPQATFVTGHTAGNSANLTITYVVSFF